MYFDLIWQTCLQALTYLHIQLFIGNTVIPVELCFWPRPVFTVFQLCFDLSKALREICESLSANNSWCSSAIMQLCLLFGAAGVVQWVLGAMGVDQNSEVTEKLNFL